jgi:hypothetical protein
MGRTNHVAPLAKWGIVPKSCAQALRTLEALDGPAKLVASNNHPLSIGARRS